MMQYREFGRTGWNVSEIAFGGWQLGGQWGNVDDEASIATLLHAFEQGVNFVDTAEYYGEGHSEEVIGRALQRWHGDKVYVATKVRPVQWPSPDEGDPQMRGRYPEWYVRHNVEQSLRRLGVERLDLFQLHGWFPQGITQGDWLEVLNALRQEGKIDRIGVSIRDYRPEDGVDLARFGLVDSPGGLQHVRAASPTPTLSSWRRRWVGLHREGAVRLRLAHRSLDEGHLLIVARGLRSCLALSRQAIRGNARTGGGSQNALHAVLQDVGGGSHALRVVVP